MNPDKKRIVAFLTCPLRSKSLLNKSTKYDVGRSQGVRSGLNTTSHDCSGWLTSRVRTRCEVRNTDQDDCLRASNLTVAPNSIKIRLIYPVLTMSFTILALTFSVKKPTPAVKPALASLRKWRYDRFPLCKELQSVRSSCAPQPVKRSTILFRLRIRRTHCR